MDAVSIVAAYRFVELADCAVLRDPLFDRAQAAGLKGTVLLAPEGINFTLAGAPAAMQGWLDALLADARFQGLELKQHNATALPFKRLRVKVKREIIRMNENGVRPQAGRAPAVDSRTLVRWLADGHCDEGRPVVMLDTRNGFEVDAGAFEGAIDWRLQKFSDFPAALEAHRAQFAGKTVVSYCTGGIRCEKAALWMRDAGIPHVLQLDGGILRYFEETPGAPGWQGRCFVFDERLALDDQLQGQPAAAKAAA
ncbi:MAG: sulfurtransferase [Rubrivivax sp.]|nr:sulfurtransferase [Rubrivivax sp.]